MTDDATVDAPTGGDGSRDRDRFPPGYDILGVVGTGGYGTVYRARDRALDRVVALKVLTAANDPLRRERFVREARTLAALSAHPHVAALHTAGQSADGTPWFTMDLYAAGSASGLVDRSGPRPWPEVAELGAKIASALQAAHDLGVVHRDVKPSNILLDDFGQPRLADFGVARLVEQTGLTRTGVSPGTIVHMAPELFDGSVATAASDTYGLASTLCELLTGAPPFAGDADEPLLAVMQRASSAPPPDLLSFGVPPALADVIAGALAKDPSDRPPSAAAFGAALTAAARTTVATSDAGTTDATRSRRRRPPRASRRVAIAVASTVVIGLAIAAASVAWVARGGGPEDGVTAAPAWPTADAALVDPVSVAVARDGAVHVADRGGHRIVRIGPDGRISTVAGRGQDVDDGDGGRAIDAGLASPGPVAFDQDGRLLVVSGGRLRRVLDDGTIVAVDIDLPPGIYLGEGRLAVGPDGTVCTSVDEVLLCGREGGALTKVDIALDAGTGTGTGIGGGGRFGVNGFAFAGDDLVLASDDAALVVRGPRGGPYRAVAGGSTRGDGAPATEVALAGPVAVAVESDGSIVVAEAGANRVRRVGASDHRAVTIAGKPDDFSEGDRDAADPRAARFNRIADVAAGHDGDVFVVDRGNDKVRRIARDGGVSTVG